MRSSFTYSGKVTINLKLKDKTIPIYTHNQGTTELFLLFAKLLSGTVISKNELPYYLDIQAVDDSGKYITCLHNKLIAVNSYKMKNNTYVTTVEGTVYYQNIDENIGAYSGHRLALLSRNETLLAYIFVDYDTYLSRLSPGTQAVINWELSMDNQEDESSEDTTESNEEESSSTLEGGEI